MRLMRKRTKQAGVTILDHSPALELLVDEDGSVAGASGLRRQKHDRWTVRARAVVIATGGCAFLSKTLGSERADRRRLPDGGGSRRRIQ
jgi:succinate dehydrogenase/fumarate reductase flavoprotein subunit